MTTRAQRRLGLSGAVGISLLISAAPWAADARSSTTGSAANDVRSPATATATAVRTDPPEAPPPPPPPSPPPPAPAPQDMAVAVVELTNQRRAAAGRAPLSINGSLTGAAVQHSDDQAARRSMGHTGSDGSDVGDRIAANGGSFRTWGENVAYGYPTPDAVVTAWMNSSGHRRNMLNASFSQIGVAASQATDGRWYWTMVLAG